jgi:hypothetical protein
MRARLADHASHGLQRPATTANEEPRMQREQSNMAKKKASRRGQAMTGLSMMKCDI